MLPVPLEDRSCARCGASDVLRGQVEVCQDPLFLHGGYGERRVTLLEVCFGCDAVREVAQEARSPR